MEMSTDNETTEADERIRISSNTSIDAEEIEMKPKTKTIKKDPLKAAVRRRVSVFGSEKTAKPIIIADYIINHPCKIIFVLSIVFIIVTIADSMVFGFSDARSRDWFVSNSHVVHRYDAIQLSLDDVMASAKYPADPKTQEKDKLNIVTLFKTRDGSNILQPAASDNRLSYIAEVNDKIVKSNYPNYFKLCLANSASLPNCSSTAVYDPLISSITSNGYTVDTITQSQLDQVVNQSIQSDGNQYYAQFQTSFATDPDRKSQYYRAFFKFGLPYPDINDTHSSYKTILDNYREQRLHYDDWILPIFKDIQLKSNDNPYVEVVISGHRINAIMFNELIYEGTAWALASIIAVWLIMLWHMKSVFLATIAITQIILGFPFSYFFYRIVFNISYFGFLHSLVIFIILGIAADDCFVFVDAWQQSRDVVGDANKLIQRMSYTYKRAAHSMAVTTFTTVIAFLATGLSPMMPIAAFGIWAGTVVFVNYLLMITFFPACLSWYHQHVKEREKCPKCCWCFGKKTEEEMSESRPAERFFRDTWSKWMMKGKYFILAFFAVFIGISVWQASQLQGLTKQETYFEDDHYMEKMFWWMYDFYGGNTNQLTQVTVAWGIEPRVDRSGSDIWSSKDIGRSVYDDSFDLSPTDAQQYIYDICEELKTNHSDRLYSPSTNVKCFMNDLIDYANTSNSLSFPFEFSSTNATLQRVKFNELISNFTATTKGKLYLSSGNIGYKGTEDELEFIVIEFTLQMFRFDLDIRQEYNFWEAKVSEWNENAPTSVSGAFQTSFGFSWMDSKGAFMTSAVQGIAIALPAAFVVLVLSTHNWIVSLFATLTIVGILLGEVMLMVLRGWELGVSESVAIVIMIGFSVDYVVHFASAYVECPYSQKRDSRIRFSLFTMGISIIGGAITTFASGFFLIFPEMLFFKKFGFLVMTTIALSLLYAMTFFIALLAAFGPNGNTGTVPIKSIFARIKKVLCCKRGQQHAV